jgi:hypothetical protein
MTRKHFQLIAETIRELKLQQERLMSADSQREVIAKAFAEALRSTNSNFDAERFVSACLGEG